MGPEVASLGRGCHARHISIVSKDAVGISGGAIRVGTKKDHRSGMLPVLVKSGVLRS
jgi:hypothetical protein